MLISVVVCSWCKAISRGIICYWFTFCLIDPTLLVAYLMLMSFSPSSRLLLLLRVVRGCPPPSVLLVGPLLFSPPKSPTGMEENIRLNFSADSFDNSEFLPK